MGNIKAEVIVLNEGSSYGPIISRFHFPACFADTRIELFAVLAGYVELGGNSASNRVLADAVNVTTVLIGTDTIALVYPPYG